MGTKILSITCLLIATCLTSVAFANKANTISFLSPLSSSNAADEGKMCHQAAANLKTFIPKMMKLVEDKVDRSNPDEMRKYSKFKNSYNKLEISSTSQLISECKNDKSNKSFYNCAANAGQTERFIVCVATPRAQ